MSIHAIATFQALHDYLRPRVAGLLSSSRLSGMFAALAASGFVGSSSKPASEDSSKAAKPSDPGAESSAAAAPPAIQRRQSQRLGIFTLPIVAFLQLNAHCSYRKISQN